MPSTPEPALPRFVVLRATKNNKYVQYVDPDPVEDVYLKQHGCGLLRADGEDVLSSYAKFELEAYNDSTKGKSYFRLRSCYNNKYIVSYHNPRTKKMTFVAGGTGGLIDEMSVTMKTDRARPPEGVMEKGIVSDKRDKYFGYSLFVYEAEAYVKCGPSKNLVIQMMDAHNGCFPLVDDDGGDGDILAQRVLRRTFWEELMEVIDWETLVAFPKHVAFKGDNGKYLIARDGVLEFSGNLVSTPRFKISIEILRDFITTDFWTGDDGTDEAAVQEVVSIGDGTIRIKSILANKFWDTVDWQSGWVQPKRFHPEENDSNKSGIFMPLNLTDNITALRKSVGDNYYFCKRLDKENDRLAATTKKMDKYSCLTVEEVVLTKSIYDVEYRMDHVRVYDESTVSLATHVAANKTDQPLTTKLALEYASSRTSKWSTIHGGKLGTGFKIPLIGESEFEIEASDMGDQNEKKIRTELFKLIVAPNTSAKVDLLATRGYYDVPFNYTKRETDVDGMVVIDRHNDGVFTGTECYNLRFDVTECPLQLSKSVTTAE
ncbi:hypothetical protein LINGRAHAP2_LOCUS8654 [Linum grandiflorum]